MTLLAALAALAAILVVVASAGAGKVRQDFSVPGGATKSHSFQCPGHEKPTSGGFGIEQGADPVVLEASHPTEHGWSVELQNKASDSRSAAVIFLCSKPDGLTLESKNLKTTRSDTDAQITAHCRNGTKAIGGGGELVGHISGLLVSSVPVNNGNGWAARWHLRGNRSVKLRSYAICEQVPGYYLTIKQGTVVPGPGGSNQNRAVAHCEDGDELLGGGFARIEKDTFYDLVGPKLGGWEVSAYGPRPEVPFISLAICH